jgi:hypothetical protein
MHKLPLALMCFLAFGLVLLSAQNEALARCICTCVNGKNVPLCTSTLEIPPICPSRICPIEPLSLRPLEPLDLPPLGTQSCRMEQVLNPYTGVYEWRRVCR